MKLNKIILSTLISLASLLFLGVVCAWTHGEDSHALLDDFDTESVEFELTDSGDTLTYETWTKLLGSLATAIWMVRAESSSHSVCRPVDAIISAAKVKLYLLYHTLKIPSH